MAASWALLRWQDGWPRSGFGLDGCSSIAVLAFEKLSSLPSPLLFYGLPLLLLDKELAHMLPLLLLLPFLLLVMDLLVIGGLALMLLMLAMATSESGSSE